MVTDVSQAEAVINGLAYEFPPEYRRVIVVEGYTVVYVRHDFGGAYGMRWDALTGRTLRRTNMDVTAMWNIGSMPSAEFVHDVDLFIANGKRLKDRFRAI